MAKVLFLGASQARADAITSRAPSGFEVSYVDRKLSDYEKAPLCRDADALIVQGADISVELLRQCPRVKLVQATSAGYNRLGLDGINKLGIPVASNGGANAVAVAEHTIALMICVGKRTMLQWDVAVRQWAWREEL